ncbi:hypothetical protein Peur_027601 [Populus x canadensis]
MPLEASQSDFATTSFPAFSGLFANFIAASVVAPDDIPTYMEKDRTWCSYIYQVWKGRKNHSVLASYSGIRQFLEGFSFQWRRALTIVVQSFALSYRAVGFIFLMKKIPGNCCSKLFFIA